MTVDLTQAADKLLAKLEPSHQKLLAEIDKGIEGNAELIIPDSATPKQLLAITRGLVGIISNSEQRISVCAPLLARALWMVRDSKEFLVESGYMRIGDYVKAEIESKMSRSVAYLVSSIWEKVPELKLSEAMEMGTQTLITATRALGENPSPDFVEKVMTMARESEDDKDFKRKLAESGNIVEGSLDTARITLSGPVPDLNDLKEHLNDRRFQKWALELQPGQSAREDFKDALVMILAAIEHSMDDWPEEDEGDDIPPHAPAIEPEGPTASISADSGEGW